MKKRYLIGKICIAMSFTIAILANIAAGLSKPVLHVLYAVFAAELVISGIVYFRTDQNALVNLDKGLKILNSVMIGCFLIILLVVVSI